MEINSNSTLLEIKEYLKKNYEKGIDCPCCRQFVKIYKRKLNTIMAQTLIRLYWLDKNKEGYYHCKQIVEGISDTGTNDFSKLIYWGLVEEKKKEVTQTKTRTSGYWKITDKGKGFVLNQFKLPSYTYVYNGKSYGFSEQMSDIEDCLGVKFNYKSLMANR